MLLQKKNTLSSIGLRITSPTFTPTTRSCQKRTAFLSAKSWIRPTSESCLGTLDSKTLSSVGWSTASWFTRCPCKAQEEKSLQFTSMWRFTKYTRSQRDRRVLKRRELLPRRQVIFNPIPSNKHPMKRVLHQIRSNRMRKSRAVQRSQTVRTSQS